MLGSRVRAPGGALKTPIQVPVEGFVYINVPKMLGCSAPAVRAATSLFEIEEMIDRAVTVADFVFGAGDDGLFDVFLCRYCGAGKVFTPCQRCCKCRG